MDAQTIFHNLRNTLATLYTDNATAERVALDAGLNRIYIAFDLKSINTWQSILSEAIKQRRMEALLFEVALVEFPNHPTLQQACDNYRVFVDQEGSFAHLIDDRPVDAPQVTLADALAKLASLPLDTIPSISALPTESHLPHRPNSHFVGREDELKTLAKHLKGGDTVRINPAITATGMGGIGKTQLAVAFAHRYGQYFAGGVHWVSMADPASVMAEIAVCGQQMAGVGPDYDSLDLATQVQRVMRFWQQEMPRLLIFDNCEDPALLARWQPTTGGCRVLVTSRRQQWSSAQGVQTLALTTLTRAQSIELLLKFRPDLAEATAQGDDTLDAIAATLGDLQLALHLAGSYLETYRHDIQPHEYLHELHNDALLNHESLQNTEDSISPTEHDLHVARTFALSTQKLDPDDATDALALALLTRMACFAPNEPLPRYLLMATVNETHTATQKGRALCRLLALGLVEETSDGTLLIHRLVMHYVQGVGWDDGAQEAVEIVILHAAHEINEAGMPSPLLAWQPHLRYATDQAFNRRTIQTATLCNELGHHLQMIGVYEEAKAYYEQALAILQKVLGKNHPDTATTLNNLGLLLSNVGEYEDSKAYHEQALTIRISMLSENHPDIAISLNNIGLLMYNMGEYEGAKSYYKQALVIRRQVLGENHPDIAQSLNNLGLLLYNMGEYEGAKTYYEQALIIQREMLGEQHPFMATSLNNIGLLMCNMGEYKGAKSYYEQALTIQREILGENHPNTAASLNNLGTLLESMGDYQNAKPYHEQALTIRISVLGENHPDTAASLNNLGTLLASMEEYEGAKSYYEQALTIYKENLGENHPHTAASLNNLGTLLASMGDYKSAKSYHEQSLTRKREILGEKHPDTATSLNNLGSVLASMGEYEDAKASYEQALFIYQAVVGEKHPDTAASLNNIGLIWINLGGYSQAAAYLAQAVTILEDILGFGHPHTQTARRNLERVRGLMGE
ncbi:MAG: tetratricopeptide repeat protein [Chloroflexota bacterium]